jgi:hypothetical protein
MTERVDGEFFHHISRYSFDGPGNHQYIVLVENYQEHIYAIKFYLKSHAGSEDKYKLLTGFKQAPRIIRTCLEIMLTIVKENRKASFCILGTNLDNESKKETKRFRVYKRIMQNFFSPIHFEHRYLSEKSLYFLINKENNTPSMLKQLSGIIAKYHLD